MGRAHGQHRRRMRRERVQPARHPIGELRHRHARHPHGQRVAGPGRLLRERGRRARMREAQRRLMWKVRYYMRRYDTPATYVILAVMVSAFITDFFFGGGRLTAFFAWSPSVDWLRSGAYWEPLTFPFVHSSILGLLFDG